MTQQQPNQDAELARVGRFFVRRKLLGVGYEICRLEGALVTVVEERISLAMAEFRCRELARLDPVSGQN